MSDTNTAAATVVDFSKLELQRDPVANERFVLVEDDKLKLVEAQINREKSEYKGVTYFRPEYKDIGYALARLGADTVLDLLNAKLAAQVSLRVGARIEADIAERVLPDPTKNIVGESEEAYNARRKAKIAEIILKNPVVFSIEDAYNYVPGERELSMAGIVRKIGKLMAAGTAYFAQGKHADGIACFDEVKGLNERLTVLMQKARDEATASVESQE